MERKECRHHTREFKLEAVRLAAAGDKTKAKVARELGVRVSVAARHRAALIDSLEPALRPKHSLNLTNVRRHAAKSSTPASPRTS